MFTAVGPFHGAPVQYHPEPVGDLHGQLGAGSARRRGLQELHDLVGELDRAAAAAFVVEQPAHPGLLERGRDQVEPGPGVAVRGGGAGTAQAASYTGFLG